MRVFYAAHDHFWEDGNLLAGLVQVGADVARYDPGHSFDEVLGPDWSAEDRARASERLLDAVRHEHRRQRIDLFFSYLPKQLIEPDAVYRIRELGILTVNYWCNSLNQFDLVEEIAPAFDYCAVAERAALPRYLAIGARPLYMQLAANPDIYKPYDLPSEFDVTFVGQRYGDRPEYVSFLLRNRINVRVWGPGWTRDRWFGERPRRIPLSYSLRHPRSSAIRLADAARRTWQRAGDLPPWDESRLRSISGASLPRDELVKMYSRSRISVGFSAVGPARYRSANKVLQVRLRDFEAPMSGATYLVQYMSELESFYVIGKEVDCYGSREELLSKVRYYLAHPDAASRMARAGRSRALREHTWRHRFEMLFQQLPLASELR